MNNRKKLILILLFVGLVCSALFPLVIQNYTWRLEGKSNTSPKLSNSSITITSPENKSYSKPMHGYYPSTYGFDNEKTGTSGTDLEFIDIDFSNGTSGIHVIDEFDGHKKVIHCENTESGWWGFSHIVENPFSIGTVEFYWKTMSQDIGSWVFSFADVNIDWGIIIYQNMLDGGDLWYFGQGDTFHDLDFRPVTGMWHHFSINIDTITGTWSLNIDGRSIGTGLPFRDTAVDEVYYLHMRSWNLDTPFDFYYDAFGITGQYDNYQIGNNLYEGLFIDYQTTFDQEWVAYSLDRNTNTTIFGNHTIPMPNFGTHSIQISANNSVGTYYQSEMRYFTVRLTSVPASPKYKYVYENDLDYSSKNNDVSFPDGVGIIGTEVNGQETEWSQEANDSEYLQLGISASFLKISDWAIPSPFSATGAVYVESHNIFEEQSNPSLGAYVDWDIDMNFISLDFLDIESTYISLTILKSTGSEEELVTIEDFTPQKGTFYLSNFDQYIGDDGKVRFALKGFVYGYLPGALVPTTGSFEISVEFKALRVVQELMHVNKTTEKRTLILVHGFEADGLPISSSHWNAFQSDLGYNNFYENIHVISYYGAFMGQFIDQDTPIESISGLLASYLVENNASIEDNVDFICHSMGGLVVRYMIKHFYQDVKDYYNNSLGRNFTIRNVCMMGTPNHGVWFGWLVGLAFTQALQMASGSPFLNSLNSPTEIPASGVDIKWFTYRSGRLRFQGIDWDGVVAANSVRLNGAINKGLYPTLHSSMPNSKMLKNVLFNDLFKPPQIIQHILNNRLPGKIIGIEDLTLDGKVLSIKLPLDIVVDIDPNSVYIELDAKYQMTLNEGTSDTYEVQLPLGAGNYSFLITANALDNSLYQITGNLKILPDISPPIITITSLTDGLITNQDVTLIYSVKDDRSEFSDINITGPVNGTIYSSEGTYHITIAAMDEVGNNASTSISFIIDKTAPVITIDGPSAGYYNTNQTVIWYVSDDNLDPDQVSANYPSGYTFSSDGTYQVTINASDLAGNTATVSSDEFVIDKIIPQTSMIIGSPHFIINDKVHLASTTTLELIPDNLLDITFFRIYNGTYDSGLMQYNESFSLNALGLFDGIYELSYYSVDFANNIEVYNYQSIVLDNSPPKLKWLYEGYALQDSILFEIEAEDLTGVLDLTLSIRDLNGLIVAEIPVMYTGENNWSAIQSFDTMTLPDGYYELIVFSEDLLGFTTTKVFSFSIRNLDNISNPRFDVSVIIGVLSSIGAVLGIAGIFWYRKKRK